MPALLCFAVLAAYAPSLDGGFLNYDDPWLIGDNPVWHEPLNSAARAIFLDMSRHGRLLVGAEFLPVRDVNLWVEAQLHGLNPQALRWTQLLLYISALLWIRAAMCRTFGPILLAELTVWLFALHPVHTESVAWLAGRKDVLSLLFVGIALYVHAAQHKHRHWALPTLVMCAGWSKTMGVMVIGLFIAQDLIQKRTLRIRNHLPAWLAAATVISMSLYVGAQVDMIATPIGGTRLSAAYSMGPVWLRYVGQSLFFPMNLSIVHEVPVHRTLTTLSLAGYLLILTWLVTGIFMWRRNQALPLAAFIWFFFPLAPVSQILAPLQNIMADRYLWLSVMGTSLLVAWGLQEFQSNGGRLSRSLTPLLIAGLIGHSLLSTATRAHLFSDSTLIFADATAKTTQHPLPPYLLGKALESSNALAAEQAYQLCLARGGPISKLGRKASNNLARLQVRRGDYGAAEKVLRQALAAWPRNPKVRRNLVKTLRYRGLDQQALTIESAGPTEELPGTEVEKYLQ